MPTRHRPTCYGCQHLKDFARACELKLPRPKVPAQDTKDCRGFETRRRVDSPWSGIQISAEQAEREADEARHKADLEDFERRWR